MKLVLPVIIGALSFGTVWSALTRESSSSRAAAEGIEAWEREETGAAAEAFGTAWQIREDPGSAFNLGTTLAAGGERELALRLLEQARTDPALAPASFYNEGTFELGNGNLDASIEALKQSLRLDPSNRDAKRNLEIALQQREEEQSRSQEQSGGGEDGEDQQQEPDEGEQEGRESDEGSEAESDPRLESILQSVEDQEREELSRMRRARAQSRGNDW